MHKIEIQDLLCSTVNYNVLEKNLKECVCVCVCVCVYEKPNHFALHLNHCRSDTPNKKYLLL